MGQNDQNFCVGLKAFIGNEKRLLILEDQDGQWELPGGKIQIKEEVSEALDREIKEELGEEVRIKKGPVFYVWIRQPDLNRDFFLFLTGFDCTWAGGEIAISPEHKSFRWITKEEIDSIEFENTYKEAIRLYFERS